MAFVIGEIFGWILGLILVLLAVALPALLLVWAIKKIIKLFKG